MPGSVFFGDNDSMADSGTPQDILRRKFPGMISDNPTIGNDEANKALFFASGAPPSPANPQAAPNATPAPDVGQGPQSQTYNLPWMRQFNQQSQPQRPPLTTQTGQIAPGATKAQKLAVLIKTGLMGAIAGQSAVEQSVVQSGGRTRGGFGMGAMAGFEAPMVQAGQQQQLQHGGLENQILQNQVTYAPQLMQLDFAKTLADINKNLADAGKATAEGGKATAEAGAIPTKTALESAQALAARYKEDPGSGQLMDLQTGQPFGNSTGLAPLSAQEAAILGKGEGDRVPIKLKNAANEMVNRGIKSVSANGRQLMVDGQGNTIKDMGQATPLTVIQQQQAPQQVTPDMQKAIDLVGKGKMDLPTALSNFRRFPG